MKFDRKSHEGYLIEEVVGKKLSELFSLPKSIIDFNLRIKNREKRFKQAKENINWNKVNSLSSELAKYIENYINHMNKKPINIIPEGVTHKGIDKSDIKISFSEGYKNFSLKAYDNLKAINMGDRGLFTISKKLTGNKIKLDSDLEKKRKEFQREYGNAEGDKEDKKKIRASIKLKNPIYNILAAELADYFNDFLKTSDGQKKFKENLLKDMGFEDKNTANLLIINEDPPRIITEEPDAIKKLRNPSCLLSIRSIGVSTVIYSGDKEIMRIPFRDRGSQCTYWVNFS